MPHVGHSGFSGRSPRPACVTNRPATAQSATGMTAQSTSASTGRSVPAAFDRADGKFRYFHLGPLEHTKVGGADVVAADRHLFNAGLIFSARDGVLRGTLGAQVAVHPDYLVAGSPGAKPRYHVVYSAPKKLIALDRHNLWAQKELVDRKGEKTTVKSLRPAVWTTELPHDARAALIVAGMMDKLTPAKYGRYLHERLTDSKLLVIDDCGHMMALEQPDAFIAGVVEFMEATNEG